MFPLTHRDLENAETS